MVNRLVDYSSDEEEEATSNNHQPTEHKECRLLPNPIGKQCADETDQKAESVQHEGRIRSFPHERGNWASFVYIPIDDNHYLKALQQVIADLCSPVVSLSRFEEFHSSLSKTFVVRHHWIESLLSQFKQRLRNQTSFDLLFSAIDVYVNEEGTRTFVGLTTTNRQQTLDSIVNVIDNCLQDYNLPPFYQDRSFHTSILWCLGDRKKELEKYSSSMNRELERILDSDIDALTFEVKKFIFKTGNKQFDVPLC